MSLRAAEERLRALAHKSDPPLVTAADFENKWLVFCDDDACTATFCESQEINNGNVRLPRFGKSSLCVLCLLKQFTCYEASEDLALLLKSSSTFSLHASFQPMQMEISDKGSKAGAFYRAPAALPCAPSKYSRKLYTIVFDDDGNPERFKCKLFSDIYLHPLFFCPGIHCTSFWSLSTNLLQIAMEDTGIGKATGMSVTTFIRDYVDFIPLDLLFEKKNCQKRLCSFLLQLLQGILFSQQKNVRAASPVRVWAY